MRGCHFVVATVTRNARQDANAKRVQQRLDLPQLAHQVVFANDVDVIGRGEFGLACANHVVQQRLGTQLVAQVLGASETGRVDRNDGLAKLLGGALADRLDVVAHQCGHTGLVDEDGGWVILLNDLADGFEQALLTAINHVQLVDVGCETGAVQLRSGRCAVPVVPRVALAGNRPMHQVRHVRDGLQRDLGPVKRAPPRSGARVQLFGAALLALFLSLALVDVAARLIKHFGNFGLEQDRHGRLLTGWGVLLLQFGCQGEMSL